MALQGFSGRSLQGFTRSLQGFVGPQNDIAVYNDYRITSDGTHLYTHSGVGNSITKRQLNGTPVTTITTQYQKVMSGGPATNSAKKLLDIAYYDSHIYALSIFVDVSGTVSGTLYRAFIVQKYDTDLNFVHGRYYTVFSLFYSPLPAFRPTRENGSLSVANGKVSTVTHTDYLEGASVLDGACYFSGFPESYLSSSGEIDESDFDYRYSLGDGAYKQNIMHIYDSLIYMSNLPANNVRVYDLDGVLSLSFASGGSGNGQLNYATGIDVNADGVYLADAGNNRIQLLSDTGTYISQYADKAFDLVKVGTKVYYLHNSSTLRNYTP